MAITARDIRPRRIAARASEEEVARSTAGSQAAELVTTTLLVLSWVLSCFAFVDVGFNGHDARVPLFNFITSGDLKVDWALRIDPLTAVMLVVVTTISALVHLYSIGYMADDPAPAALLLLSVVLHLRHADAGDGRQSGAAVLRLGRRGARELSADRLLVPQARGQCRGDQGLHRQPHRRLRLRARNLRASS